MAKVKVNTLWSLDSIDDKYYFDTKKLVVYNTENGKTLAIHVDTRGYPVVDLRRRYAGPHSKAVKTAHVKFHKIVALACINNGPYDLIEHLDDNPLNYTPDNLLFSNRSANALRMYANGKTNHTDSIFELALVDGTIYRGNTKQIAESSGIPRGTIYDRMYKNKDKAGRKNKKHKIHYIKLLSAGNELTKELNDLDSDGFLILHHLKDIGK